MENNYNESRDWFNSLDQNDKEFLAKHYIGKNHLSLNVNDIELIYIQEIVLNQTL